MSLISRIICIVLDGVGVGELPDADRYGDVGSDSLGNTSRLVGALRLPTLAKLGIGNIIDVAGAPPVAQPAALYGKMSSRAPGKDSTSGHWELMGCVLTRPFPTYPGGFPGDVVAKFERAIGQKVLGNIAASGTEIIQTLGDEHVTSGRPILYTSQDSVFQIAAHEQVVPVDMLYRYCEIARAQLSSPPHNIGRVIARPFLGKSRRYYRTPRRKDFSMPPPGRTVLDALTDSGRRVTTIGKIDDLFNRRGITDAIHTENNTEGMEATLSCIRGGARDFLFTNLLDFDTMWGHRNDARAYALGLEEFDSYAGELLQALREDDLLIITSDHGNDPTTPSTDHSREYVPLLVYHNGLTHPGAVGTRESLSDVGKTVLDIFTITESFPGTSLLPDIIRGLGE
ncbi:MAG: phosphopentomutase [Candidatus Latescibacterota bacterium]